ncbi:hypothetical protein FOE78_04510 [Microlunatus elymi]|uniref:Uncharacterized protein n=1 Tax=Microlunatus elymi TaxID=2596828 RepID=A0A516PVT2_9ACTN|nr:hypothetical protein [Microlunatus elymi]QDP95270.1 hypothetical protein FOE78_04510 [Microlunatus elymi]
MARNLILETEPWAAQGETDHITERLLAFMKAPRLLAPGSRIRVMWSYEKDGETAGAPAAQAVTAVYTDDAGVEYRDHYTFGLDEVLAAAPVPSTGARTASGEDKALKNIDHAIRSLSANVAELRR